MFTITIATLNIVAGSRERVRRIIDEWIGVQPCSVYVFTEVSHGPGTALLLSELRTAGWIVCEPPLPAGDRGVVVASRLGATCQSVDSFADPAPGRCAMLTLDTFPRINVIGMYVPNRGNDWSKLDRKRKYLACWQQQLNSLPKNSLPIIIGDLNIVPEQQHPVFLPQQQFEYEWYRKITNGDFYDAAAGLENGHEFTWVAHNGEGYTYDHILPHRGLRDRVQSLRYDHSPRQRGISDHSAMVVALDLDSVSELGIRKIGEPAQMNLF